MEQALHRSTRQRICEDAIYITTCPGLFEEELSEPESSVETRFEPDPEPRKIFKAVLTPSQSLEFLFIRNVAEDENYNRQGVFWRVKNGKTYAYRVCDDPCVETVCVTDIWYGKWAVETSIADDISILHNGKLITVQYRNSIKPRMIKRNANGLLIELPKEHGLIYFADQSSTYVYFIVDRAIHTLHTVNAEFLPPLQIIDENISTKYLNIAGVYNYEMFIDGIVKNDRVHFYKMFSAWLPDGYRSSTTQDYPIWQNIPSVMYVSSSVTAENQTDNSNSQESALPLQNLFNMNTTLKEGDLAVQRDWFNWISAMTQQAPHPIAGSDRQEYMSRFATDFDATRIIGVGGFGIVFEALNKLDEWRYAVKRISVSKDEHAIAKALREVRTMGQLNDPGHPGIVLYNSTWIEKPPPGWQQKKDIELLKKFKDSELFETFNSHICKEQGIEDVFIYIQMQLCRFSLSDWLKLNSSKHRNLLRMRSWFKQIVSAVAYIHEKGLIHRDLKPSNILFVAPDHLKLCDMGIARQLTLSEGTEVAKTYTITGTPLYMAPEQSNWDYDSKVDVFTLGLILAELCIPMTEQRRNETFTRYRCGKSNDALSDQPQTAEFIAWLAHIDSEKRPKCKEILAHPFLA